MNGSVLIGCGYLGARLARRAPAPVQAFTGSAPSAARLVANGIAAQAWDLDDPATRQPLEGGGRILFYLAPPPPGSSRDERIRRLLANLVSPPRRTVYVSTTGVYGDAGGAVVDEDSPLAPQTERARARADAEQALRDWAGRIGAEWAILRVPGIYGPGRLPLAQLDRGDPVLEDSAAGPGNRIHVDDLASICLAAATRAEAANRVYNVGDGDHASRTAYFDIVARLSGRRPPPRASRAEAQATLSPAAWSFMAESRRVDTARLRRELGVSLRYAELEAGVRASLLEQASGSV